MTKREETDIKNMWHHTAIIALGVISWWLLGLSYISVSSRYWPRYESMRGKWTPSDALTYITSRKDMPPIPGGMEWIVPFTIALAFVYHLTIWPISIYHHAKRGFGPEKEEPDN